MIRRTNRSDRPPRRDLDEAQLRAQEAHERRPRPLASPGERRREQHDLPHAVGVAEPQLERDPPAHAVADEMRARDPHGVHEVDDGAGEEWRVIGRQDRLRRVAEARQVERDHREPIGERRHRRQERSLRGAEPVDADRRARPSPAERIEIFPDVRLDALEAEPRRPRVAAGRGEEPDAEVQVVANDEPAGASISTGSGMPCGRARWPVRASGAATCTNLLPQDAAAMPEPWQIGSLAKAKCERGDLNPHGCYPQGPNRPVAPLEQLEPSGRAFRRAPGRSGGGTAGTGARQGTTRKHRGARPA